MPVSGFVLSENFSEISDAGGQPLTIVAVAMPKVGSRRPRSDPRFWDFIWFITRYRCYTSSILHGTAQDLQLACHETIAATGVGPLLIVPSLSSYC